MSLTQEQVAAMPWPTTYWECVHFIETNDELYELNEAAVGVVGFNPHVCQFEEPNPTWAQDIEAAYATWKLDKHGSSSATGIQTIMRIVRWDMNDPSWQSLDLYSVCSAFGITTIEELRAVFAPERECEHVFTEWVDYNDSKCSLCGKTVIAVYRPSPPKPPRRGDPRSKFIDTHRLDPLHFIISAKCYLCGITYEDWQALAQPTCNAHRMMLADQAREPERCANDEHEWDAPSDIPQSLTEPVPCLNCPAQTQDAERVWPELFEAKP